MFLESIQYYKALPNSLALTLSTFAIQYCSTVQGRMTLTTHRPMMGPSHPLHHIDIQCFIDISSLDGSPHTGRNPVLSKSATDGCIELFWSISFYLLCLGMCVCVSVCVCIDDLKSRRGGLEAGGGKDTMIRSGPLTSLCADKVGRTLTHTLTQSYQSIKDW